MNFDLLMYITILQATIVSTILKDNHSPTNNIQYDLYSV